MVKRKAWTKWLLALAVSAALALCGCAGNEKEAPKPEKDDVSGGSRLSLTRRIQKRGEAY